MEKYGILLFSSLKLLSYSEKNTFYKLSVVRPQPPRWYNNVDNVVRLMSGRSCVQS